MRKLIALVDHLLAVSGLAREQATAFADEGTLLPTGRHLGFVISADGQERREQLEVGIWSYEGVIQLERYPFDGPTLLSHVLSWLADADAERQGQDVKDPKLTVHINDAHTCDVEIAVEFEEALTVVECMPGDAPGPIVYQGKCWRLTEPDITPAQRLTKMEGRIDA